MDEVSQPVRSGYGGGAPLAALLGPERPGHDPAGGPRAAAGGGGRGPPRPPPAAIFVDGRYTLQAQAEVDGALYVRRHLTEEPPSAWIAATLKPGETLACDPRLHTLGEVERFRAAAEKAGGRLAELADNPL